MSTTKSAKNTKPHPVKRPDIILAALLKLATDWRGTPDALLDAQLRVLARHQPCLREREKSCGTCGCRRVYNRHHDAYYCPACNRWLELACRNPRCRWCADRPPRPLAAPAAQPPADYGVLRLPPQMAQAVITRCKHLRSFSGESQTAENERQSWALMGVGLESSSSREVRREVAATFDHLMGDCLSGLPRGRRSHDQHRPMAHRERKLVASYPVLGKPSLSALRIAFAAAGFRVERLALSGDQEVFIGLADRPIMETDAEVEYQVHELPPQERLTTREAHRTIIRCLRAAGFDVGFGEVCVPNSCNRNCWSGSSLTGPRAWVKAHGPVTVAPLPDGDHSAAPVLIVEARRNWVPPPRRPGGLAQ